jgi:hypothetical protein
MIVRMTFGGCTAKKRKVLMLHGRHDMVNEVYELKKFA